MKKKNGLKIIQTAGYNGARTVFKYYIEKFSLKHFNAKSTWFGSSGSLGNSIGVGETKYSFPGVWEMETAEYPLGTLVILRCRMWVNFTVNNHGELWENYIFYPWKWGMKILGGPLGLGTPRSPLGTLIFHRSRKWGSTKTPFLTVLAVRTVDKQATEVTWKKKKDNDYSMY